MIPGVPTSRMMMLRQVAIRRDVEVLFREYIMVASMGTGYNGVDVR